MLAATLPVIQFFYSAWGFDMLSRILAVAAAVILVLVSQLPARLLDAQSAKPVPAYYPDRLLLARHQRTMF